MTNIEALRLELKCREMVEGTNLNWYEVLKHNNEPARSLSRLNCTLAEFEVAHGIVEGKPAWEGDTIYFDTGIRLVVCPTTFTHWPAVRCTWNPPKPKTVMVELPVELAECYCCNDVISILAKACRKALEQIK